MRTHSHTHTCGPVEAQQFKLGRGQVGVEGLFHGLLLGARHMHRLAINLDFLEALLGRITHCMQSIAKALQAYSLAIVLCCMGVRIEAGE